jgi:hypothetical protein
VVGEEVVTKSKRHKGLFSPAGDSGDMEAIISPYITKLSWIIKVTRSLAFFESSSFSYAKSIKEERKTASFLKS